MTQVSRVNTRESSHQASGPHVPAAARSRGSHGGGTCLLHFKKTPAPRFTPGGCQALGPWVRLALPSPWTPGLRMAGA